MVHSKSEIGRNGSTLKQWILTLASEVRKGYPEWWSEELLTDTHICTAYCPKENHGDTGFWKKLSVFTVPPEKDRGGSQFGTVISGVLRYKGIS